MSIVAYQYNFEEDELCHLMSYEDFSANSVITVQYGQEAVLIKDGVPVGESLLEGRHCLDSTVLSSIAEVDKQVFKASTYHIKVYYVNVGRDITLNWGTSQGGFSIEDIETGYRFRAGASGSYSIAVQDAKLFLYKTVGQFSSKSGNGNISFSKFDIQSFILNKFQEIVKSELSKTIWERHIPVFEYQSHLSEISDVLRQRIHENGIFPDYGFSLKNFSVTNIAISDDDYRELQSERNQRLKAKREADLKRIEKSADIDIEAQRERVHLENINQFQNAYSMESNRIVLNSAVQNEASGQGMNLGLGLVYAQNVGSAIGGMMNNMSNRSSEPASSYYPQNNQTAIISCPSCGKSINAGSAFCNFCGNKIIVEPSCPKCGAPISGSGLFCSACGSKLLNEKNKVICKACGRENETTSLFCSNCGGKINND